MVGYYDRRYRISNGSCCLWVVSFDWEISRYDGKTQFELSEFYILLVPEVHLSQNINEELDCTPKVVHGYSDINAVFCRHEEKCANRMGTLLVIGLCSFDDQTY